MAAPTQPPAADRSSVEARSAGDPPARAASPATARSTRVPPMTARAGSRRGRSAGRRRPSPRPMSMRTPTATRTERHQEPSPAEQVADAHPGARVRPAPGSRRRRRRRTAPQGDQDHAPQIGRRGRRPPRPSRPAGRPTPGAGPAAAGRRARPCPTWLFFAEAPRRDRDGGVALPLGRDAPDRPAGRLVAVVTVGHRLLPAPAGQWDTTRRCRVGRGPAPRIPATGFLRPDRAVRR